MFSCSQLSLLIELNVDYLQYISYIIIIQQGRSVADTHDTSHWSILENTCSAMQTYRRICIPLQVLLLTAMFLAVPCP